MPDDGWTVTGPGVVFGMPDEVVRIPLIGGAASVCDVGDVHLLVGYAWRLLHGHNGKLYAYARVPHGTVYMHRVLLEAPVGVEVDHWNGDGLDNRRSNLRLASQSQNSANSWKPRRPDGSVPSSRFKGVTWDRSRGRWQAKIQVQGVCRNLGRYDDEEAAAKAYDTAAVAAWGDFAWLNFAAVTS